MFDEVNRQLEEYFGKWRALIAARQDERNKEFFERLKPTAVGWKVADFDEYRRLLEEWRGACDIIVEKWMDERWVAKLHLKDATLNGGIEIVKIMQRRPGSEDKLGLDHVDFLDMEETNTKAILQEENDIQWTEEKNGNCEWISLWFEGTEAKLRPETILDVARQDLLEVNNQIRGQKFAILGQETGVVISDVE